MGSPQIVQAFSVNCTGKPCKSNLQVKPCILEITGILRNHYLLFLKKLHGMSLYLQTLYKFRVCTCKVPVIPCNGLQCSLMVNLRFLHFIMTFQGLQLLFFRSLFPNQQSISVWISKPFFMCSLYFHRPKNCKVDLNK